MRKYTGLKLLSSLMCLIVFCSFTFTQIPLPKRKTAEQKQEEAKKKQSSKKTYTKKTQAKKKTMPDTLSHLSDDEFLDAVQKQTFEFFRDEVNPENGMVRDRASNHEGRKNFSPASIASVGFGLTAYGVAVERGWMEREEAIELTKTTLKFALNEMQHKEGFFYHFVKIHDGMRASQSEVSPIDTAIFLAGALFAAGYYGDPEIKELAQALYDRMDFKWMLNGGKHFALAWTPETGFHNSRWAHFDESLLLYIFAIGSNTHPIPAQSWHDLKRPLGSYKEHKLVQMPPLFTHQYPHVWLDFRDKNDGYMNYFTNSIAASKANRAFTMDQADQYKTYRKGVWGLTACDGPYGYKAYGAPPGHAHHDGTIPPTGCGSSIVFTPKESIECLRSIYKNYRDNMWGRYGFADAFNLDKNWFDDQVIGIDQGALILMIENYRSQLVWLTMMRNRNIREAFRKVGFVRGDKELPWPEAPSYKVPYVHGGIRVDGFLRDWKNTESIQFTHENVEFGNVDDDLDLSARIQFAWDEERLYVLAKVRDDDVYLKYKGKVIWRDDILELFVDPDDDGLYWKNDKDFQIGIRPAAEGHDALVWSWFQGAQAPEFMNEIQAKSFVDHKGYILEASIPWSFINIKPKEGKVVRLSPSIHDIDGDKSEAKLQWFFFSEGGLNRFTLGKLILDK